MKNRIHKILGIGLALVLALALVAGFALPVAGAETINKWYKYEYPAEGALGDWFYDPLIDGIREITEAINGDLYVYVEVDISYVTPETTRDDHIFKSEDGGRTWAVTGYAELDTIPGGDVNPPGTVFDMVCSSIDEDIVYATDGYYVYKSIDGGDEFTFVARDSLEEQLMGECGISVANQPITCIDVGYDDDENPFVFIGTKYRGNTYPGGHPQAGQPIRGSVYWIGEAGYPATWTDLDLTCYDPAGTDGNDRYDAFAIGTAPDFADSKETFVVVSDNNDTHVVSTIGVTCSWTKMAELFQDCDSQSPKDFDIFAASRIAFPDDWEDTETLFVGVVDLVGNGDNAGGDVYRVTQDLAIDMNVEGILTGCVGKVPATDIISLDIMGDTDDASLIAGAYGDTNVYYSYDGGWDWDISEKDPTGDSLTYVIWYEGSALAATGGDEAAVSMSCVSDDVEDVGEAWNQISLISTDIDCVIYGDHSPGYITESETMFMLTAEVGSPSQSLFRDDGTYWERVYCSTIAGADVGPFDPTLDLMMVMVSPDFNTTNTVYLANDGFQVWRSQDAGCSWDKLTFPCTPRDTISAGVVIDEDTVITGGNAMVYKTTRHGARPWDEYELPVGAGWVMSFDLEPGYEDPGSILLGDNVSQVFISEDGGEEWELVGAGTTDGCQAVFGTTNQLTSVVFDPDYATNDTIYAAAGNVIARCIIDPDEDMADQAWVEIYTSTGDVYWGMVAAGDTALYVGDKAEVKDISDPVDGVPDNGGVLRSLNPLEADEADVVFERLWDGLTATETRLSGLLLTTDVSDDGCAENVLWSLETGSGSSDCKLVWVWEDTLAAPVVLDMPLDEQKLTTTNSATISWNELCGADCYEVSLWEYCPECPDEKIDVPLPNECGLVCTEIGIPNNGYETVCVHECTTEDICIVVDGLDSGTTYYWQVRVCQGQPYLSKWSLERSFKTALLDVTKLCSPECGGQAIILTPNFSWDKVKGATGYDIELATTETFTAGVVRGSSTVNAWVTQPLEYATTYYWRVRAEKDGVYSDWAVCIFTTMEEAVPPPPPVVVEPTPPAPVVPAPIIEFPPTPNWVWAIIAIGTALVVVVIVLTVRTRRPPA